MSTRVKKNSSLPQPTASALPIGPTERNQVKAAHAQAGQKAASQMPSNRGKSAEYGKPHEVKHHEGSHLTLSKSDGLGSLSETNDGTKTGGNELRDEQPTPPVGSLARQRVGTHTEPLTTNQGVAVADNQSSLKAGVRGPTLLEDFILREKLTHFDHERIPERVVHARGSAAHGYFESHTDLRDITRAAVFEKGKRTPVFVRFSTVAGERGSADTARDARGFAVKFYTDEGNWDLVGNNIPVFFIQDAMKFPDLIHAVKPEPHNGIPQAASAHDTFWDFVSLMPESTHMLCWVMSDRALPRSLRMMQGFGVHTFRLVNAQGQSVFCKFHWTPLAGVHSLLWDEAVRISGADPDFHRRDLWEAIESGAYPEWELGVQIFTEEEAEQWSFDVLDATKLVPQELCAVTPVGRLVLNRNPDNFFAETEQVAFCTAHVVPGIDFSNDPLLAGRHHSYLDTQLSRLGGPNFHELPINAPLAPVANNQRDAIHRSTVHRGKVAYEPNSLAGGCPFQAGMKGYVSFPAEVPQDNKLRGKPEKFGEHYAQARLFFNSLTLTEQRHMEDAFRFELSKVTVPAIRQRMLAGLIWVNEPMAARLARSLGVVLPEPLPLAVAPPSNIEVEQSAALSQTAFPGDGSVRTRQVAVLVTDGGSLLALETLVNSLAAVGVVLTYISHCLGAVHGKDTTLSVDATFENSPSVLFDAVLFCADDDSLQRLLQIDAAVTFVREQHRHLKTIGLVGGDDSALPKFAIPVNEHNKAGVVTLTSSDDKDFIDALAQHRHSARAL
jgi:catalase